MFINKLRMFATMFQLMFTVSVVIILMFIFKKHNRTIRRKWGILQIKLLGIDLQESGKIDNQANMIIMNHQSLLDIIILESLHSKDIAWIAKKEIANLFWFGNILKIPDMIIVQRENKASLLKLLKDAKEKFKQNRPLVIFPEGTRTDGTKLRKFKAGAKVIAQKNNFKVQPIIMIGTRNILDSQKMIKRSGTVKVIYLPSIIADPNTTWYEDTYLLMEKVLHENNK